MYSFGKKQSILICKSDCESCRMLFLVSILFQAQAFQRHSVYHPGAEAKDIHARLSSTLPLHFPRGKVEIISGGESCLQNGPAEENESRQCLIYIHTYTRFWFCFIFYFGGLRIFSHEHALNFGRQFLLFGLILKDK